MLELPQGFELIRRGRLRLVVRRDLHDPLSALLTHWASGGVAGGRPLAGGRGETVALELGPELCVVLRPFLRGGWLGRINRRLYLGAHPRPFQELALIQRVRDAGLPTVEPLAAAVEWVVPGCYRGALVTREIPLAVTLWQYLREVAPAERQRICEAAARATRRMHDLGIVHPDLNLENYLVRRGAAGREVLIIDFDRARLRRPTDRDRRTAFARLCRSMRRLDPEASVLTLACVEAFHAVGLPG